MRKLINTILFAMLALSAVEAIAYDSWVSGYVRQDGTYIKPYLRDRP